MFEDIISYAYLFFFYVIPWLLMLLAFAWIKDWITKLYVRARKKALMTIEDLKEDRWNQALLLMKIIMFLALLLPLLEIVSYLFDTSATDIGTEIFTNTMFVVFIVITAWYMLAMVVQAVYIRNRRDIEQEKEEDL